MIIRCRTEPDQVDRVALKRVPAADRFDSGRTPDECRHSFAGSDRAVVAFDGDQIAGTARLLSDGVCNACLVDV